MHIIKELFRPFWIYLKVVFFNLKWRKFNTHNLTIAGSKFPLDKVSVGNYTYGKLDVRYYRTEVEHLKVGNFCSIGPNVKFLLGGEHVYTNISTYPIRDKILNNGWEAVSKGPIIIEDDVWIGSDSVILSGVTIGQGAVIGTGSVVAKDVPAYSIFCNNQVIKYRFSEKIIKKLLEFDYSSVNRYDLEKNIDILYGDINQFLESKFYKQNLRNREEE